ncbi:MAG: thiamine-phosphate kinase [Phycisphaerales bacterium]|jgi:thiamine-monophosphate kinase|nr:thiamine-phosphate kinase [Phycisphaerales bacterium]
MNEQTLLDQIYKTNVPSDDVLIGPGDDMAFVSFKSDGLLCGVDQLIVGRHVVEDTAPELIGRKAIARCFSDLAAMGGVPTASLMTAALPAGTNHDWAMSVFEGARVAAKEWGGPIVGGDIASTILGTPPIFSVTAFGYTPYTAIQRHAANVGDVVYVTGSIGNSLANHHLTFVPRIQEAQSLLQSIKINTMIDISDGLGIDGSRLTNDRTQIVIDTSSIPLREGASIPLALSDGEDYELLFTSSDKPPTELATPIGFVQSREEKQPKVITTQGDDISSCGWVHE